METYDVLMMAVLVGATLFGAWKGMAWQVASLASLVASIFVALRYSDAVATMLPQPEPWNRYIAMLLLYLGSSLAIWMLFRLVAGLIDRVRLKEFDHQVGAVFGAVKGALLCVAITFFAVTLAPDYRDQILSSRSGSMVAKSVAYIDTVLPADVRESVGPYLEPVRRELNPAPPPLYELDPSSGPSTTPPGESAVLNEAEKCMGVGQGGESSSRQVLVPHSLDEPSSRQETSTGSPIQTRFGGRIRGGFQRQNCQVFVRAKRVASSCRRQTPCVVGQGG